MTWSSRRGSTLPIEALIFDVDGTLAETEEFHRRAFNAAFTTLGLDWFWDRPLYADLLKVTGGRERIRHFMDHYLSGTGEARDMVALLHQRKNRVYAGFVANRQVPLRPGMRELIAAAQGAGLKLAIATTTSPANVDALLTAALGSGWREVFPVMVAGDMVKAKKPAPDVYHAALARLRVAPEAALAIEDSRNGVLSATGAGLRVAAVRSAYTAQDDLSGAVRVFDDPVDLTLASLRALA